MMKERIAKLSYQGEDWDKEGAEYIVNTKHAREAFERSLDRFVKLLAKA